MSRVLIATSDEYAKRLEPKINRWALDQSHDGNVPELLVCTDTSGYAFRSRLAGMKFDELFEVGPLPQIYVTGYWDGHPDPRRIPAAQYLVSTNEWIDKARIAGTDDCTFPTLIDGMYANVGQLVFEGLAGVPDFWQQYDLWFDRRHSLSVLGWSVYSILCRLNDRFNYDSYAQIGNREVAEFAKYPKSIYRYSREAVNGDDGDLSLQLNALIYMLQSGGFNFGDGQYLYEMLHYNELFTRTVQAPLVATFGSHLCEWTYNGGSIVRAVLVELATQVKRCMAVNSFYNHYGGVGWSKMLNGGTSGDAATACCRSQGVPISILMGDPSVRFDASVSQRMAQAEVQGNEDEMTQADRDAITEQLATLNGLLNGRMDRLEGRVFTVETAISAGGGGLTNNGTNYALAANGGVASASSYLSGFPIAAINNGDRKGLDWGKGGWNSAVNGRFPEWVKVKLPTGRPINRAVVCTVQDDYSHPVEPTTDMVFTKYGIVDFTIEALISGVWTVVETITGNNKVMRDIPFPTTVADDWRTHITKAADGYCRVTELELYGP